MSVETHDHYDKGVGRTREQVEHYTHRPGNTTIKDQRQHTLCVLSTVYLNTLSITLTHVKADESARKVIASWWGKGDE